MLLLTFTALPGMAADPPEVELVKAIVLHKDVLDDLDYKIVKTLYDNWTELAKVKKKAIEDSKPENALLGNDIPVHPGALRYYKEMGIAPK